MNNKKFNFKNKLISIFLVIINVLLIYFAFFSNSLSLIGKIFSLFLLEISFPISIFIFYSTFIDSQTFLKIFFKFTHSKFLLLLLLINFDFITVCIVFSVLYNLYFLICLSIPLFYLLLIILLWNYCNYDSEKLNTKKTDKYLGVGISNHFMFNGVDILAEKNCLKTFSKTIKLINPFNTSHFFITQKLSYISGKDYKFYIATHKYNELFTLIFLVRNKDSIRYFLNKNKQEDFKLNKNIYIAYCLEKQKIDESFIYFQDKLRYKLTKLKNKYQVQIEQKTELPHLTSNNKVSNWFGDSFMFEKKEDANRFVKFVMEQNNFDDFNTIF